MALRGGGLTGGFGGGLGDLAICFTFLALARAVQQVRLPLVVANELIRTQICRVLGAFVEGGVRGLCVVEADPVVNDPIRIASAFTFLARVNGMPPRGWT